MNYNDIVDAYITENTLTTECEVHFCDFIDFVSDQSEVLDFEDVEACFADYGIILHSN